MKCDIHPCNSKNNNLGRLFNFQCVISAPRSAITNNREQQEGQRSIVVTGSGMMKPFHIFLVVLPGAMREMSGHQQGSRGNYHEDNVNTISSENVSLRRERK